MCNIQPLTCRIGLHKYTLWQETDQDIDVINPITGQLDKIKRVQFAWCKSCFKTKYRTAVVYRRIGL